MKVLSLVFMFCFIFFYKRQFPCFNNIAVVGLFMFTEEEQFLSEQCRNAF